MTFYIIIMRNVTVILSHNTHKPSCIYELVIIFLKIYIFYDLTPHYNEKLSHNNVNDLTSHNNENYEVVLWYSENISHYNLTLHYSEKLSHNKCFHNDVVSHFRKFLKIMTICIKKRNLIMTQYLIIMIHSCNEWVNFFKNMTWHLIIRNFLIIMT